MKARHQLATLIVLSAALLVLRTPVAADGPNTTTQDVFTDSIGPDPCTGEDVEVSGTVEVSATITMSATRAHVSGHSFGHLVGAGLTSGVTYTANVQAHVDGNVDIDPLTNTGVATIIARGDLISQGSAPNQFVDMLVHVTINADGSTTATVDHVRIGCQ